MGQGAGSVGPASVHTGDDGYNPENNYLQIAIEYGVIGVLLWLWCRACVVWVVWRRVDGDDQDAVFAISLLV